LCNFEAMKIELWTIGKSFFSFVDEGEKEFTKRISKYIPLESKVFNLKVKSKDPFQIKKEEAEKILQKLQPTDILWLLDENGISCNSRKFAKLLQNQLSVGVSKKLIFLVGGAYGFDLSLKERANQLISLSPMTFSHQLIRLIFLEQLYRAFTIINNEPYHND
jgi:23S rRNA (pseudouridine1915-N3)-methyltransferase